MRSIKFKFIIYALVFAFAINTTSCSDFLDQESKSSLSEEEVVSSLENIELLIQGLYTKYRGCKEGRNGLMVNLGLDESQQGNFQLISSGSQAGMDKYNGLLDATSTQVAAIWENRWPAASSAALAVYGLEQLGDKSEKATQLLGEASFIRGMLMLELSMYWGEIPIKDKNREKELGLARQPLKDVWAFIINDFKIASNNLPDKWDDPKRATSGAALAMLGKAYMYAPVETGLRDFSLAKECFDKMIGRYDLVANFEDLYAYDKPNSVESIFELQFNNIWPDCNYWQFDCGSRAVDAWFSQRCHFSGYDFLVPTPFAYRTVAQGGIWEDGDLRKEASIRYDFTYHGVTPDLSKTEWTGTTDELEPHIKKFEDPRTDQDNGTIGNMWNSGKNFAVIRLADILLLQAECLNELGNTADAISLVNNRIRTRAWGGSLPADKRWGSMSQAQFREKIMDERFRELCFEGWRRMDLIRTGTFVNLVKERNRWAKQEGTIQEYNMRYPIPDTEIKNNDDIGPEHQNPGYTK
ncbi:RagB/SusD family nutrient uptake outer membrane protein [Dysgonomonas sp. ZJ279]|uniref:RagB/SusD family nutrient uptake outer membrane protein n=1 Tax=Dysgonomonas sp. ZJ279 TaxID=2709796 RepID=UPI0013ED781C|nr:RagB/SusD family nutrient uptake outer membrane protein [Dysgonomonas sp. ZJ279]